MCFHLCDFAMNLAGRPKVDGCYIREERSRRTKGDTVGEKRYTIKVISETPVCRSSLGWRRADILELSNGRSDADVV